MICAWEGLLNILPLWMRQEVDKLGKAHLQELRLRLHAPPVLRLENTSLTLKKSVTPEDMLFCVNAASKYSPWTAATALNGYITAPGGHRIGLCGKMTKAAGSITGINGITSLCIRVARDFSGIAPANIYANKSVLIIGSPGSGKTTLLRDLIRQRSNTGCIISVVDEREEIFPRFDRDFCFSTGENTDILSGCKKAEGIDTVLRTMGPDSIAVDEITAKEDCQALIQAGWCGVSLLATAHAGSRQELEQRPVYRPILESRLFDALIVLNKDKSYHTERLPT